MKIDCYCFNKYAIAYMLSQSPNPVNYPVQAIIYVGLHVDRHIHLLPVIFIYYLMVALIN